MSEVKESIIRLVEAMPDDCSKGEILRRLYFHEKYEQSSRDIEAGRVHTQDEVDERMEQWLASFGPTQP